MLYYDLSITISGPSATTDNSSHWALMIHREGHNFGDLHQVELIDDTQQRFLYDYRTGQLLDNKDYEGRSKIATLTSSERNKAARIIQSEAPPCGTGRCQDWIVDVLIALQVEELIPDGTAELWGDLMGCSATEVRKSLREKNKPWTTINPASCG